MEVDPGTPLFNRQISSQQQQQLQDQNQPPTSPNSTKAKPPGAKIVKSIRPVGPRVVRPPPSSAETKPFECDEFADINPFASKPKIGFDSATSSSSSISNDQNIQEDINPFQTRRTLARSPSPPSQNRESTENLNDEWETHKKRTSSSAHRKSSISVNTANQQIQNEQQNQQQQQQQGSASPNTNQSSSTSVVSSTTDLSSASSISPQENQQIENKDECNEQNENNNDPFNTPPKVNNKITSRNSLSMTLTNDDSAFMPSGSGQLLDFESEFNQSNNQSNNSSTTNVDSVIFDSIFSNDTGMNQKNEIEEKNIF